MTPRLSIVILSWNTRELTLACLAALARDEARHEREILILDNGSEDGSADAIAAEYPELTLLREPVNHGYAIGNNLAAKRARGDYILLLNSDTEVQPGALDAMVDFLDHNPEYGACAPKLVHPSGEVQRSCKRWPGLAVACVYDLFWARWPLLRRVDDRYFYRDFDHLSDRDVEQPPGAAFLVHRELWEELRGLDESLWLFYNDVDFCRRLHGLGKRIRYLASCVVVHHEGASTSKFVSMVELWARNRMSYYRKHHGGFGLFLVRLAIRIRGMQEWWAIGRRLPEPEQRRAARAELRSVLRRVFRVSPEQSA